MPESIRDSIIREARARQGVPYRLDPPPDGVQTLDCSLYVLQVAQAAGVGLPAGVRTAEQIRQATVPISWDAVLPGDLLFFEHTYDAAGPAGPDGRIASHVGISLGAGTRRMLDANDGRGNVGETDISTPYWQEWLFEARRLPALAQAEPAPTDQLHGIDVSVYQGAPDWAAAAASGASFAIAKATQRTDFMDKQFAHNWREIRAAGLVRGAYHFAEPDQNAPAAEAEHFLAAIEQAGGLAEGDLLALDLEDWEGSLARASDVGGWALAWLRHVRVVTGVKPFLYTNPATIQAHSLGGYPALAEYPLWLASYRSTWPPTPAPWGRVTIWQRSSTGAVAGISGNVDLDEASVTREQLLALGKPGAVQPPSYVQPGDVGSGILAAMAKAGTRPAAPSTFLPLGRSPALIEECVAMSGELYRWHIPTGTLWRYPATTPA